MMYAVLAFGAGFALAWWYRPKWMVARLKRYVETHPEGGNA